MKFECVHIDTCIADYWSGHHLPHVQIPVWPGMSLKDIKDSIKNEIRQGAIAGSTDYARLLSGDIVEPGEEKLAAQVKRAAYAAVNRIKPAKKGQRKFFTNIQEPCDESEYCETVYAWFVFVEI